MKLYCIGVGPGNPELLTKEALEILNRVDVIFSGAYAGGGYRMAETTISDYIKNKTIITYEFGGCKIKQPGKDRKQYWKDTADTIFDQLKNNGGVGIIITPGDPALYSAFWMMKNDLEKLGVTVEIIDGVTAPCVIAKAIDEPLLMWDDTLIITSPIFTDQANLDKYKTLIEIGSTIIFMKGQHGLKKLVMHDSSIANIQAAYVRNAGMDGEHVFRGTLKEIFDTYSMSNINNWRLASIVVKQSWQN